MKKENIIFIVLIIGLTFGGYFLGKNSNNVDTSDSVITASENVDIEEDATTTKVVAPVANKPVVKNTTPTPAPVANTNNYIKMGQRVLLGGVYVTPTKVTYDSRCPKDVQCIQAGTVEVSVLLESSTLTQNVIISLNKPVVFASHTITLAGVSPSKTATKMLTDAEYSFLITSKR